MALYRSCLPQLSDRDFLTDSGLETTLVFHHGIDLPCFAALPFLMNEDGRNTLQSYFGPYVETAGEGCNPSAAGLPLDRPKQDRQEVS